MKRVRHQNIRLVQKIRYVKDLLVANGREWNMDLLHTCFPEEVLQQIVQIKPGGITTKESFAWEFSKDGQYSVKSGYWVIMEVLRRQNMPQEVAQPSLNPIFQQVWKVDAPPKLQHFMWHGTYSTDIWREKDHVSAVQLM